MARKTPELNLQAELPEVRSTDFNLFYRPEQAPVDKSVDIFTRSIDNFVNNAGTAMVLNAERKEKEVNDAEAIKQFNENRTGFNEAVKKGQIPKEANPYFLEKYKELTLNKKAREFRADVYRKYSDPEFNVLDNPDPQAFDKFYNDQLKEFMGSNNMGAYDAMQLEKGFFTETSKTRNSLFNTHVQSQMGKIADEYEENFKEGVQGFFDKSKSNEEIGADISEFILDKTKNGLGNNTAKKYLLKSLSDWSKTTGDLEFAERLLRDLPNHLQLGTGKIADVKGLQNDLDALKENIDTRILQKEKDEATKLDTSQKMDSLEASEFANKYETYSEALLDEEFNTFSRNKQNEIFKEFESREQEFDSKTDPRVEDEIYKLLEANNIVGARDLLKKNIPNVTSGFYSNMNKQIQSFEFTKKDGLLASKYYQHWKNEIEDITKSTNKSKYALSKIDPLEHKIFEGLMRDWLSENPADDFKGNRKTEFEKYVKDEYEKVLERAISGEKVTTGETTVEGEDGTPILTDEGQSSKPAKIKADKSELKVTVVDDEPVVKRVSTNSRASAKPENRAEDPELKIDLAKFVIIPNNISKGERLKLKRENKNTITQKEYDRILEKQTNLQIAKGNN